MSDNWLLVLTVGFYILAMVVLFGILLTHKEKR